MKATISFALTLLLMLLLIGCDSTANQPAVKQAINVAALASADAIKLAKNMVPQIKSTVRIYNNVGSGGDIQSWPDTPSSSTSQYLICGNVGQDESAAACYRPITYTTSLNRENAGGYHVIFSETWIPSGDEHQRSHRWEFHVAAGREVTFVGEEGDELPQLPRLKLYQLGTNTLMQRQQSNNLKPRCYPIPKIEMLLMLMGCVLLLAGCGSEAIISDVEVIQAAKQAEN